MKKIIIALLALVVSYADASAILDDQPIGAIRARVTGPPNHPCLANSWCLNAVCQVVNDVFDRDVPPPPAPTTTTTTGPTGGVRNLRGGDVPEDNMERQLCTYGTFDACMSITGDQHFACIHVHGCSNRRAQNGSGTALGTLAEVETFINDSCWDHHATEPLFDVESNQFAVDVLTEAAGFEMAGLSIVLDKKVC